MSDYIPPLRYRFLTRLYDPVVRLTTRESAFKLTREAKITTLRDVRRVLAPKGSLHIADWGRPSNALMRTMFLAVQLLDGFGTTRDSVTGALPELLRAAGFDRVAETAKFDTPLGTMRLFRAA